MGEQHDPEQVECVKAYVVHQKQWWYNDEYHQTLEPGTPVKTFLVREKAEVYRREKECSARKKGEVTNPFSLQGLDWGDWASLPQGEFDQRMQQLGVTPLGRNDPWGWWDDVVGDLTDEQRNAIWDLLDQISLFEVVETEVELEE